MPGHILHAQCPCGFERKLSPGSALGAGGFVGYTIAYNADESDLLTMKPSYINTSPLRSAHSIGHAPTSSPLACGRGRCW
jgi:hypothetical protein